MCFIYMVRSSLNRVRFGQVYLREKVQTKRYYANKTTKHILSILNTKTQENKTRYSAGLNIGTIVIFSLRK